MWSMKSTLRRARPVPAPYEIQRPRSRQLCVLTVALSVVLFAGVAGAQYPLLDRAANKVIQKYHNSSCEQLWQERGQPKSQREQEAVNFLRSDPQMRRMFIDRVAPTVANKMFECGMIP
jgi:hypothetical protein